MIIKCLNSQDAQDNNTEAASVTYCPVQVGIQSFPDELNLLLCKSGA